MSSERFMERTTHNRIVLGGEIGTIFEALKVSFCTIIFTILLRTDSGISLCHFQNVTTYFIFKI